ARHQGPLVILNDCCHAESFLPHLEKAGIAADRCLLLSTCTTSEVTIPGTGREVEAQWSEGKVFQTVVDEEMTCSIDMTPYVPPLHVRAGRQWKNARIRLGNMLRSKRARRPTFIFVNSPPNGWAKHEEKVTIHTFGLRWVATL